MKLLLDENLPHVLRHECVGHDARTVAYMGWSSLRTGELLARAAGEGFDVLISLDRGFEQRRSLPISVVLLRAISNDPDDLRPLMPRLLETLKDLPPRSFFIVG